MIAQLQAKLGLDSTAFKAGINDAKKSTDGFQSVIKSIGSAIGIAFSVHAVVAMGKAFGQWARDIALTASNLDITTGKLLAMQRAAKKGGMELTDLRGVITRLNSELYSAIHGSEASAKKFTDLGLSIDDMISSDANVRLEKLAKALFPPGGKGKPLDALGELLGGQPATKLVSTLRYISKTGIDVEKEKALGLLVDDVKEISDEIVAAGEQICDPMVEIGAWLSRRVKAKIADVKAEETAAKAVLTEKGISEDRQTRLMKELIKLNQQPVIQHAPAISAGVIVGAGVGSAAAVAAMTPVVSAAAATAATAATTAAATGVMSAEAAIAAGVAAGVKVGVPIVIGTMGAAGATTAYHTSRAVGLYQSKEDRQWQLTKGHALGAETEKALRASLVEKILASEEKQLRQEEDKAAWARTQQNSAEKIAAEKWVIANKTRAVELTKLAESLKTAREKKAIEDKRIKDEKEAAKEAAIVRSEEIDESYQAGRIRREEEDKARKSEKTSLQQSLLDLQKSTRGYSVNRGDLMSIGGRIGDISPGYESATRELRIAEESKEILNKIADLNRQMLEVARGKNGEVL